MAEGLTWGGTPASGQDAHAALGMQNLSSGISPCSLPTSVEEQEKNHVFHIQWNRDIPLEALLHQTSGLWLFKFVGSQWGDPVSNIGF